jgi:CheY-like chemotaxis protein
MKKNRDNATILIVEDSITNVMLLKGILENENYSNILTAHNGKESLKIIASEEIDLILLDIMMPQNLSGIDVLKKLKSEEKTASIPVVVISAINSREQIKECEALGATKYMEKPINIELLITTINSFFE